MKVKQIKVFPATTAFALEKDVNDFLTNGKISDVYDIKFECIPLKDNNYVYSCLVIYGVL